MCLSPTVLFLPYLAFLFLLFLNYIGSPFLFLPFLIFVWGWSGGAKVLDELPAPGRPTIWIIVGQGPTALAVGAGGGCLDIFTLIYHFPSLSPSLWETARYRLKYCLKGPLNPKQPTNQHNFCFSIANFSFCILSSLSNYSTLILSSRSNCSTLILSSCSNFNFSS